jgi:hypothetical protein
LPAVTVVPEGVAAIVKSAKKMVIETEAVCPAALPVTTRFRGFADVADSPVTESVLDCPGEMVLGLKLHVAPEEQDKVMGFVNVLGPAAEIEKVAVVVPIRSSDDRAFVDSENSGFPVPDSSNDGELTALELTMTLPVMLPVVVGAKLTETVQVWPAFKVAGAVGRLVPQLLVTPNPAVPAMLVMVTA